VSLSANSQRLAQAQRIAALKVRRQERERIAAAQAEREARNRAAAAKARSAAAAREQDAARALFFAQPQHAAADVWLIATSDRARHASGEQRIAEDRSLNARAASDAARRLHERACERADYLETRAATLAREGDRRAQDRADEDMQERGR
jgi:hypothetical protein